MTIITEPGFEISDSGDNNSNGQRSKANPNGYSNTAARSRKAKKRAAAKARREAAATKKAEAEKTEAEVTEAELTEAEVSEGEAELTEAEVAVDDTTEVETVEAEAIEDDAAPQVEAETAQEVDTNKPADKTEPIAEVAELETQEAGVPEVEVPEVEVPEVEVAVTEDVMEQPKTAAVATNGLWTGRQMAGVAQRALAVFVVLGMIGYAFGAIGGGSSTARAEFVYTLDESVPDSFLREDRRLLTQVVTFKSDAVLTPVAEEFDLTVDELRSKIDVETLNLSEVLRLDVEDRDADRAIAINQAVLDQYLRVIADASPAGDGEELESRRAEISAQLDEADASRLLLLKNQEQDVTLQLQQESLQRRISAKSEQVSVLQQNLDAAVIQGTSAAQRTTLVNTLTAAEAELTDLEASLLNVGTERAELATATTAEPRLLREIERLEAKLSTVDNELAERELAPLVASPIRELSDPIVLNTSRHLFGLQGMALGILLAAPLAALVAYRARKRQLWFD